MASRRTVPDFSEIPPDLFDVRVAERHIREGRLSREQYEAWLAALPDEAADAASTTVRMSDIVAGNDADSTAER